MEWLKKKTKKNSLRVEVYFENISVYIHDCTNFSCISQLRCEGAGKKKKKFMSLRISFSLCLSSRAAILDISFRLRIKDESRRGAGKNRNRVSAANKPLWVCWRPLQGLDLRKLVLSCARGKWRRCSASVCWSAAGAQSKQKAGRPRPSRTAVVGLVSVPAGVTPCRWIFI